MCIHTPIYVCVYVVGKMYMLGKDLQRKAGAARVRTTVSCQF